jgi:hypothetical protein
MPALPITLLQPRPEAEHVRLIANTPAAYDVLAPIIIISQRCRREARSVLLLQR